MNLDAYTVRKIAPKLLVAVIGVNLSIYLCVAAIDITNIVGGGLGDLLRAPFINSGSFGSLDIDTNGVSVTAGGLVGVVGAGAMAILVKSAIAIVAPGGIGILPALGLLFLAIIVVVFVAVAILATLVIRYGAILFLTIISPLAIACWVLPGTEKYFRQWWDIFLKTFIVYPIIAAIFAISDILGAIFLSTQDSVNNLSSTVSVFVALFALYAPVFMIPFAFKMAGGFLGQFYDFVNKQGFGRLNEKLNKWKQDPNSWYSTRQHKLMEDRRSRGATVRQIGSGIAGGFDALKNKETRSVRGFRHHYGLASGTLGDTLNYAASKKRQEELEALGLIKGNDDVWEAFSEATTDGNFDEAKFHATLMKKNADMYGEAGKESEHTEEQISNREEATALAKRVRGQLGAQTAQLIASRETSTATTAYNHGGVAQMAEQAERVGGSGFLRHTAALEAKDNQKKLGRLDTGGGSSAKMLGLLAERRAGLLTDEEFEAKMIDSAIEKNGVQSILNQDHNGTVKVARRLQQRLQNARASGDDGRVQREAAHMAALFDSINYGTIENKEDIVDEFFGKEIAGFTDASGNALTGKQIIAGYKGDTSKKEFWEAYGGYPMSTGGGTLGPDGRPMGAPPLEGG